MKDNNMTDGVVLLHGILRTQRSMAGMADFLARQGYRTLNLNYPSSKYPIEELIELLHQEIQPFVQSIQGDLHFVGHSMGGLLIRAYIHRYYPQPLKRVVMLGTPNHGSEVADFLKDWWIYKKVYGAAGQQLVTSQESFKEMFGEISYETGIIAGNSHLDPLVSAIIHKPHDGKVSVESTRVAGMKDHIVVSVTHALLPMSKWVRYQTLHFLQYGSFFHVVL